MIEKLRAKNKSLLEKSTDEKDIKKYTVIGKLLKDNNCFFKISIEEAFALLRELNYEEKELKSIYSELIDSSKF